jgi:competence protein ComEC
VGFQLSYLAVLGIVTLQPGLYRLWEPKYLFWDHIWRISSVAIAAQLATFSLGLFYFNQFPNLFLVSNLFVIPGAFLILLLGLCLLAVSFAAPLASAVGWLLHGLIYGLNTIIFALEKVPFSQLENVYINSFQCILLLACVAVVYLLVETRKFSYLVATAVICLTLGVSMWQHYVQHIAIDLVHSGSAHFLADSALLKTADQAQYHILPNRLLRGVRQLVSIDSVYETFEGCGVVAWANETILHIYDEAHRIPAGTAFDYIVISNEAVGSLSEFAGRVKVKKIILDSSNSIGYSEQLRREAEPQTPVFSVRRSGAFTSTI